MQVLVNVKKEEKGKKRKPKASNVPYLSKNRTLESCSTYFSAGMPPPQTKRYTHLSMHALEVVVVGEAFTSCCPSPQKWAFHLSQPPGFFCSISSLSQKLLCSLFKKFATAVWAWAGTHCWHDSWPSASAVQPALAACWQWMPVLSSGLSKFSLFLLTGQSAPTFFSGTWRLLFGFSCASSLPWSSPGIPCQ